MPGQLTGYRVFDLTLAAYPQIAELKMVREIDHPKLGKIKQTGIPWIMFGSPTDIRTPPPSLGEHTKEVLASLGLSKEEIDELKKEKVTV